MAIHIGRRKFLATLGGAAAWPLAARAQQPKVQMIGWLSIRSSQPEHLKTAFRAGLNESGYVEGKDVSIEYRFAEGSNDRLSELATELVARHVDVIVAASGTPAALAAKAATKTIPIVFSVGSDPVAAGLVASLNRPGGNLTGMTILSLEVAAKRVQLFRELVPTAAVIGVLTNPTNPTTKPETTEIIDGARSLGLQVHVANVSNESDFDVTFSTLVQQGIDALCLTSDPFLLSRADQLVTLAARHRLPASYGFREFVAAGGLMSYGASTVSEWRQLGVYAGRILKGERPADLPVQQPTKFELVINLTTAKALALDVPMQLQQLADEVIE